MSYRIVKGLVSLAVNDSYLFVKLYGFNEFVDKRAVNDRSALGGEEATLLPDSRMGVSYKKGVFRISVDVNNHTLGEMEGPS